jgi:hypothetical protein
MSSAVAGGNVSGTVGAIAVRNGMTYFTINGKNQGRPGCAANTLYWMIKDEASQTGKQQIALLLSAKANNRTVYVDGTGTCVKWYDGEDVYEIRFS